MNKLFFFTFIIILIQGCVASQAVKEEVETVLVGDCKELFLTSAMHGYQYNTGMGMEMTFALAITDDGAQYCGWASALGVFESKSCSFGCKATPEEIDALAISYCEANRMKLVGSGHTNRTCKIYARNNNIVWSNYRVNRKQISQEPIQDIESVTPIQEEDKTIQPTRNKLNVDEAKKQCEDIGFKPKTEEFKNCVVELL